MKTIIITLFYFITPILVAQLPSSCNNSPSWLLGGNNGATNKPIGTCDNSDFILKSNDTNRVWLKADGRILFGKPKIRSSHPHSNSFVQIAGKVACMELVVVDPSKWSDFVFDNNYKLMPLNELENYYRSNKHLPDVPAEQEVMKNGINTAEMDAILLQKIEELTLYIVKLNKEIELLKQKNQK